MNRLLSILCLAVILLAVVACRPTPTPAPPTAAPATPTAALEPDEPTPDETPAGAEGDVLAVLASTGEHGGLIQALEDADLIEKLSSDGPYTLFAPNDAALDAVDAALLDDPDLLFDILLYHAVEQALTAEEAIAQGAATSLLGDELTFTADGETLAVDGVPVVQADIMADNGIVHTIDAVLMPPTLGDD